MKQEEVLRIIAEAGPHAKELLHEWMALQWAEYYKDCVVTFFFWVLFSLGLYVLYRSFLALHERDKERRAHG